MNPVTQRDTAIISDVELHRRREVIRRGLTRSNRAAAITLVIVVALALSAVWQARMAWKSAEAAEVARTLAQASSRLAEAANLRAAEELWRSQLIEAKGRVSSSEAGRRLRSLQTLEEAAKFRPSVEVRNETLRSLLEADIGPRLSWIDRIDRDLPTPVFDMNLERYALGDYSGSVSVRRATDHAELARFAGPKERVRALMFSPDGGVLAARFEQGVVQAWGLERSNRIVSASYPTSGWAPFSIDFHPDNRTLAVASTDEKLHRFDLTTGEEVEPVNLGFAPHAMSYSPSGRSVALAFGSDIRIWSFVKPGWIYELHNPGEVANLAWHPDSRRLAAGSWDNKAYLWDLLTTNHLVLVGHKSMVSQVKFHPRGELLFTTSWDGTTRFWDVARGQMLFTNPREYATQFSRDGHRLAYEIETEGFGIRDFLEPVGYRRIAFPGTTTTGFWIAELSPDGRWLAAGGDWGWNLFDYQTGRNVLLQRSIHTQSLAFTTDGASVVGCSSNGVALWSLERSTDFAGVQAGPTAILVPSDRAPYSRGMLGADRSVFATWNGDQIALINLRDARQPARLIAQPAPADTLSVSPDGLWLALSGPNGASVFATDTGKLVATLVASSCRLAFSADSAHLFTCTAKEITLWEVGSWQARHAIQIPDGGLFLPLAAFSPSTGWLAYSVDLRNIQLRDVRTWSDLASLAPRDPDGLNAIVFSADGSQLLAPGSSGVQMWNLPVLRRELAKRKLNWMDPDSEPPGATDVNRTAADELRGSNTRTERNSDALGARWQTSPPSSPALAVGSFPSDHWAVLTALGVLAAIGFGFYIQRYQQRLFHSYAEIEAMVEQRNRQLERAQNELFQSQKLKALGTLAAGIAHDFNNLLSVIRLSNDFIARGVKQSPDLVDEVESIEQAVQQGKSVVRSMLGYSRRDEDHQPASVADLVEDTVTMLGQQFLSGIRLTVEMERELPGVVVARSRLEQIVLNLVVNAAAAMKGHGELIITSQSREDLPDQGICLRPHEAPSYVELSVADSGPGIPPEVLARIFEPFFTTKTVGANRGTGLGLSTVYAIAERDGLGLAVETNLGQGTIFRIFLPARMEISRGGT